MACDYYIAPTGSDSSGNGSKLAPWATINYASGKLIAGKTLCARGGTYYHQAGYIWHSSGTSAAPITFRNAPGETPVFDGEWGSTGTEGDFLVFSNNAWIVLDGITAQHFDDQYGNGTIDFTNGQGPVSDIIIQNCKFYDNGTHPAQDHHVYIAAGAKNIIVRNNLFVRASGSAVQTYHTPAATGTKVYNNVIIGGVTRSGSQQTWGIIIGDATDAQIYNNTIYNVQRGIDFNYGAAAGSGPYVVKNNVIVNSSEFGLRVAPMYTPYFSSDNNDFYGNAADVNWNGSNMTLAKFAANTANDHHSLSVDPLFVNPGSDFHLNANSPIIQKGTIIDLFNWDMDWLSRTNGVSYSMGAYQ